MTDHKAFAEGLTVLLAANATPPPADAGAMMAVAQAATAHALLALAEKVDEVAEQLRVANVITAFGTATEESLMDVADEADAEIYVRGAVHRILNHPPHSERGENR